MYPTLRPDIDPALILELRIILIAGTIMIANELLALYLLPTYIALARRHPDQRRIITMNLAWGWTLVGWIRALLLAIQPAASTSGPVTQPPSRTEHPLGVGTHRPDGRR